MGFFANALRIGYGCEWNVELSYAWTNKALLSNDNFARGECYSLGLSGQPDEEKAFEYYEHSAKEGSEFGQYMFGWMHLGGRGTEKDLEKSFYWSMKAAEQGNDMKSEEEKKENKEKEKRKESMKI